MVLSGAAICLSFLVASSVVAVPFPDARNQTLTRDSDLEAPDRACHTPISAEMMAKLDEEVRSSGISQRQVAEDDIVDIDVYWHVVVADRTYEGGWIRPSQIVEQMDVLNKDYSSTGLWFTAKRVNRVVNAKWFNEVKSSSKSDNEMKNQLRVGGRATLNVYTVALPPQIGYATQPHEYAGNPKGDGVVINYTTLPGGKAPYNLGKSLTHETGHWLGLLHVWKGGCEEGPGDGVDDTPPQSNYTIGCPAPDKILDSCKSGKRDSVHNFMDYSYDRCMSEFTPGQIDRLRSLSKRYRGIGASSD